LKNGISFIKILRSLANVKLLEICIKFRTSFPNDEAQVDINPKYDDYHDGPYND